MKTAKLAKGKQIPASAPFRLVEESSVPDLDFGASKRGRESVYFQALHQMLSAPGSLMEVDSVTARGGITAQAKKRNITVLFAEKDGKLYVKVMGRESVEDFVMKALEAGPLNVVEVGSLIAKAYPEAKPQEVVQTLSESGKCALRTVSGGTAKKWHAV